MKQYITDYKLPANAFNLTIFIYDTAMYLELDTKQELTLYDVNLLGNHICDLFPYEGKRIRSMSPIKVKGLLNVLKELYYYHNNFVFYS